MQHFMHNKLALYKADNTIISIQVKTYGHMMLFPSYFQLTCSGKSIGVDWRRGHTIQFYNRFSINLFI